MGQSRNEDALENILGAQNELLPPMSRNEKILHAILGEEIELDEPQSRIEELLMQIYEQGGGGLTPILETDWIQKPFSGSLILPSNLVSMFIEEYTDNKIISTAEIKNALTQDIKTILRQRITISNPNQQCDYFQLLDETEISHTLKFSRSSGTVTQWYYSQSSIFSVKYRFYSLDSIL